MKSLGNGSGFSSVYTSACFIAGDDLVIIDIGDTAYHRLQKMDLSKYKNIYLFITHTHFDHVGGLAIFVQHIFYNLNKKLIIVAPSKTVKKDIKCLLKIGDISKNMYKLKNAEKLEQNFFVKAIPTVHSPGYLKDKCFGYIFNENGTNIVYTGDTSTLEPFRAYLASASALYVDISAHYGKVHLKLEDAIEELTEYAASGIKVYLMHLDDKAFVKERIKGIKNMYIF
ncbi:MAG: MBL fold metallo-hydrolase [Clostridia bacterium]|nr:MBL fold metallo-hydrolase [Clostridia bacterium]